MAAVVEDDEDKGEQSRERGGEGGRREGGGRAFGLEGSSARACPQSATHSLNWPHEMYAAARLR